MKKIERTTTDFVIGDSASTKHIERAMQELHIKTLTTAHVEQAMPKPSENPAPTSENSGATQQPAADPKK